MAVIVLMFPEGSAQVAGAERVGGRRELHSALTGRADEEPVDVHAGRLSDREEMEEMVSATLPGGMESASALPAPVTKRADVQVLVSGERFALPSLCASLMVFGRDGRAPRKATDRRLRDVTEAHGTLLDRFGPTDPEGLIRTAQSADVGQARRLAEPAFRVRPAGRRLNRPFPAVAQFPPPLISAPY